MEIELSQHTIDLLSHRISLIVKKQIQEAIAQPDMVTTKEAAAILGISPGRMRQIAERFPHIKQGEQKQGKLLFVRKALLEKY